MSNYLTVMDNNKLKYINYEKAEFSIIDKEFYYYEQLNFDTSVKFNCDFFAVKVKKTTIVLIDKSTLIKVHLSDKDIQSIIQDINVYDHEFYKYLKKYITKIINNTIDSQITYKMNSWSFTTKGIPFSAKFNDIICQNPADIDMNGNDLIGLLNLIIVKERTDLDSQKVIRTCNYYLNKTI